MSFTRLDAWLRDSTGKAPSGVPGAVVLVRLGERRVFHEAYGFARTVPRAEPMTRDTVFDLASLTKPVCTGLLAMRFWQEGRIRLDQRLSTWFPCAQDPAKHRITVRDLLCHRSGLPAWRPFHEGVASDACPVPASQVRDRLLAEPLESEPGSRETYSDLGFMLLGWILEAQGGAGLGTLFREWVAAPLGIPGAGFRGVGEEDARREGACSVAATEACPWRGRVLCGQVHDENCYLLGGVAGHAGLFSSAVDLDRIVLEIFRGRGGGSGVFLPDGVAEFFRRPPPGCGRSYALGWDTPTPGRSSSGGHFSADSYGHTGFTGTSVWMDFSRQVGVVLLTNRVHPSRENNAIREFRPRVHDLIMQELLGEAPR